ncbi:MAG: hypothetical protein K2H47_10820, partial [Muribaculaceae bacterium]|nr:hypothetical protein [Muribaculaceae bacterium]
TLSAPPPRTFASPKLSLLPPKLKPARSRSVQKQSFCFPQSFSLLRSLSQREAVQFKSKAFVSPKAYPSSPEA